MIRFAIALTAAGLSGAVAPGALAQSYPAKPVRMLIGFPAGSSSDVVGRVVALKLGDALGQQVVFENRPGAGANIAAEVVAKSPADGYTLLYANTGIAVAVSAYEKLGYDALRDLTPVGQAAAGPHLLIVNPSLPVKNVKDLIAVAKARPGQIAFASGGTGSATHLAGELLRLMSGTHMIHVPYKGAGPATVALIGGEVSWMFGTILPTLPHIKVNKLRAIAVSGAQRVAVLPEVPAVGETLKGFEASSWYGLYAPAGTPADTVIGLNREVARGLQLPEVRERLAQEGTEVVAGSPEQFGALMKAETAKWARVIREAGIKPE